MKCVKCGNPTKGNKIVCPNCCRVDDHIQYLKNHDCQSFDQMKNAASDVCQNVFLCQPIKKALKNEPLFMQQVGHVVCPYASTNLSYIIYNDFSDKELELLKKNYEECFE